MGLFFEIIVVCAVTWWMGESAFRSWLKRRSARSAMGSHDAGVWVNEAEWTRIVAELEGETGKGKRERDPGRSD